MPRNFIRVKHEVFNSDGDYICRLFVPTGIRLADREKSLEDFAELVLSTLLGINPAEEDVSFSLQLVKERITFDELDSIALVGDSRLIDFNNSTLSQDKVKMLIDDLNTTLFEFEI